VLQLADLVMVGQVGGAKPAALLLQLIQLVLHVVPLLLCHTHLLSLHFTNNHAANAAAHPASVAYGAYPHTLHVAMINQPSFSCSQCCVLGATNCPAWL